MYGSHQQSVLLERVTQPHNIVAVPVANYSLGVQYSQYLITAHAFDDVLLLRQELPAEVFVQAGVFLKEHYFVKQLKPISWRNYESHFAEHELASKSMG